MHVSVGAFEPAVGGSIGNTFMRLDNDLTPSTISLPTHLFFCFFKTLFGRIL